MQGLEYGSARRSPAPLLRRNRRQRRRNQTEDPRRSEIIEQARVRARADKVRSARAETKKTIDKRGYVRYNVHIIYQEGFYMSITNATNLRRNLFGYLDAAAQNDEKIIVTTKNGNAAIISEEYLRSLEETCYLYSIPEMRQSIEEGTKIPLDDCIELDWKKDLK